MREAAISGAVHGAAVTPISAVLSGEVDSKQAPALEKSVSKTVEFPEEDESFGEIEMRFLGPDSRDPVQSE